MFSITTNKRHRGAMSDSVHKDNYSIDYYYCIVFGVGFSSTTHDCSSQSWYAHSYNVAINCSNSLFIIY